MRPGILAAKDAGSDERADRRSSEGVVEWGAVRGQCLFFFFQAEDGIRDGTVTGVQTCALPISFANRGNVLKDLKRYEEALTSLDRALALRPNLVQALCNRGNVLNEMKRFDEALARDRKSVV